MVGFYECDNEVQIPYTVGNFVTIWDVLGSPGLCSVELVTLKRAFKMYI